MASLAAQLQYLTCPCGISCYRSPLRSYNKKATSVNSFLVVFCCNFSTDFCNNLSHMEMLDQNWPLICRHFWVGRGGEYIYLYIYVYNYILVSLGLSKFYHTSIKFYCSFTGWLHLRRFLSTERVVTSRNRMQRYTLVHGPSFNTGLA